MKLGIALLDDRERLVDKSDQLVECLWLAVGDDLAPCRLADRGSPLTELWCAQALLVASIVPATARQDCGAEKGQVP